MSNQIARLLQTSDKIAIHDLDMVDIEQKLHMGQN